MERTCGQFFVDDNIFDDHKNFIPGLFIHPAFQQLCKENINPVEEQTYDDDLHAITKNLFDLDPFSCTNESNLQKKMIKILNMHKNHFVASSDNFSVSNDKAEVRTDTPISISKNDRKICLIELKHLFLHVNGEPIYQIGAYYSNMLNQDDYIDKFTFPMLLLAIVGNQYFVYGGINYNKKIQVFFINSFSTKDRNSFHTLYQIIKFLSIQKRTHRNGMNMKYVMININNILILSKRMWILYPKINRCFYVMGSYISSLLPIVLLHIKQWVHLPLNLCENLRLMANL